MVEAIALGADERLETRPFTDPEHSGLDLERMRSMAHQLVENYDDPEICNFVPGKRAICMSDPQGRHFRIYYIRPELLFSQKNLTAVGFFGHMRPDARIQPLIQADKKFEKEFHRHHGLLSLSTVRLPSGDFGNLVLFTDPESKDNWNNMPLHRDTVAQISPPYYENIRLNNAVLPNGLDGPVDMYLVKVRYLDYSGGGSWQAVRIFD